MVLISWHAPTTGLEESGSKSRALLRAAPKAVLVGFVVSHPSDKNKDVATATPWTKTCPWGPRRGWGTQASVLCGQGLRLRRPGAGHGESDGDDPDEAGEPGERDEKEKLRAEEIEHAQFSGCRERQAENDDPGGQEFCKGGGDGHSSHQ